MAEVLQVDLSVCAELGREAALVLAWLERDGREIGRGEVVMSAQPIIALGLLSLAELRRGLRALVRSGRVLSGSVLNGRTVYVTRRLGNGV